MATAPTAAVTRELTAASCLKCHAVMNPVAIAAGQVTAWMCGSCGMIHQPNFEWNRWSERFMHEVWDA